MHPGHGDPRRRLGGGWLQRGPAAQGRAGAAAVLGERGNPGGRGVCRGGLRATAGVGRLLELPRQTPSLSPPRSSCVGGVHSPPTVSAGWGGGCGCSSSPRPPSLRRPGLGNPRGSAPVPATSRVTVGRRAAGSGVFAKQSGRESWKGASPAAQPAAGCPVHAPRGRGDLRSGALVARGSLRTRDFPAMK